MKLYFSQPSPYARKVRLAAAHLGLTERLELVPVTTTAVAEDPSLVLANPLSKIPALVLDDGSALFDSRVIVEYLDHLAGGGLLPPVGEVERWRTLRIQATADGLLDAALLMRYEVALRPGEFRWRDWFDGQSRKVQRALVALEAEAHKLATDAPLNAIATACALGYLDFRFPELSWRSGCPALTCFFEGYLTRPEMTLTDPGPTEPRSERAPVNPESPLQEAQAVTGES